MKKSILSFVIIILLPVLQSCIEDWSCDCGEVDPYYDFDKVDVKGSVDSGNETVFLEVDLVEMVLTSNEKVNSSSGSLLMACTCVAPGYMGLENEVTEISITSDVDFGSRYPSGSSLNELVSSFSDAETTNIEQYMQNINSAVYWSQIGGGVIWPR